MTYTDQTKPDFTFIHMADTHLGLNWPAIGRYEKIQIPVYGKAFGAIVDAAIEKQVDFVIHAGDLVNRPRPPTAAWNRILQELPRLRKAGIPFVVTVGSHDKPESYFDRAGGDVLQLLDSRLDLAKRVDTDQNPFVNLRTRGGKKVAIYGLGDHGREQEESLQRLTKHMTQESDFSILVMHGSVSTISPMIGPTIKTEKISELLSKRYVDYVALGHNHKRWEHKDLHIYNPGSPEFTSFADAPTLDYVMEGSALKEETRKVAEHGYYFVEVRGEILDAQYHHMLTRDVKNVQIRFNNATPSQVVEGTKQAIIKNASSSSIVRPLLKGTLHPSTSRSELDIREILSLRERMLFLEYPMVDLGGSQVEIESVQGSDFRQLINQYFKSRLRKPAEEITEITVKLVQLYSQKSKTTDQEALSLIDGWNTND